MTNDPLTPAQREVWTLHNQGHSQRAIGFRLGITREAVKDRIARAAKKLEQQRKDAA